MHSRPNPILHKDLSLENLLYRFNETTSTIEIKIIDFGCCEYFVDDKGTPHGKVS
jgi:serine/threonine protein kinase